MDSNFTHSGTLFDGKQHIDKADIRLDEAKTEQSTMIGIDDINARGANSDESQQHILAGDQKF